MRINNKFFENISQQFICLNMKTTSYDYCIIKILSD